MTRRLFLPAVTAVIGLGLGVVLPATAAVAPGCDSAHPTRVGGPIYGSDGRSLNAAIGVDHTDSQGRRVDADGNVMPGPPYDYSWTQYLNPDFPPEGMADRTGERTWGRCITAKVTMLHVEVYPKAPGNVTDHSRYGSAAHYRQPITVGATNTIVLRLPVTFEAAGGNTGRVNGYITHAGKAIPLANIGRVRAFTKGSGPDCGIEGFNARPAKLAVSATYDATYYSLPFLAGGRCGAAYQTYGVYVHCLDICGGADVQLGRLVNIWKGARRRIDFAF